MRNKEFCQFSVLFVIMAAIAVILGFVLHPAAGMWALVCAAAFGIAFFVFTKTRYNRIAKIAEQIDHILHQSDQIYISEAEEGELSILQSEISKMTLRLREQNVALKKEKEYLADSLADIAHQLRTPLTCGNLMVSLLKKSSDKKEQKELLMELETLLLQMDWLISVLLKLSRLDAGVVTFQSEKIAVEKLIHTALRPFLISLELHNITVKIHIPSMAELVGDFCWLNEAVQNILKNCIESMGDNGTLEIVCDDNLLFTEIMIHDNGEGFEKEELPYLFDRFHRGKRAGTTGYGIGLALCKTIIAQHGGTIMAKNHSLGGAVFTIRFPK